MINVMQNSKADRRVTVQAQAVGHGCQGAHTEKVVVDQTREASHRDT